MKLIPGNIRRGRADLSALDPGKQGLKLVDHAPRGRKLSLSALDPGKQGLKLIKNFIGFSVHVFQRLIQENKD